MKLGCAEHAALTGSLAGEYHRGVAARWACWIGLHKWEFVLAGPKGEDVLRRCKRCGREQGPRLVDYTGGA
jgi:hypothetical protein